MLLALLLTSSHALFPAEIGSHLPTLATDATVIAGYQLWQQNSGSSALATALTTPSALQCLETTLAALQFHHQKNAEHEIHPTDYERLFRICSSVTDKSSGPIAANNDKQRVCPDGMYFQSGYEQCLYCDPACAVCPESSSEFYACVNCTNHYFLWDVNSDGVGQCTACDSNCASPCPHTSEIVNYCTSCDDDHYLYSGNCYLCGVCNDGCPRTSESFYYCTSCPTSTYLQLYPGWTTGYCGPCRDYGCQTCELTSSAYSVSCTSCFDNTYLAPAGDRSICFACDGNCDLNCPVTSMHQGYCTVGHCGQNQFVWDADGDGSGVCSVCLPNCLDDCPDSSSTQRYCTQCVEGYYLVHYSDVDSCESCPTGCSECSTDSETSVTTCSACTPGSGYYLVDGQCLPCLAGCLDECPTEAPTTDYCTSGCYTGYYFVSTSESGGHCEPCAINCWLCSDADHCDECVEGYQLTESGACAYCPSECADCNLSTDQSSGNCKTCNQGYYLLDSNEDGNGFCQYCPSCGDSCPSHSTNQVQCSSCHNDEYLLDYDQDGFGLCYSCGYQCAQCSVTSSNMYLSYPCVACQPGYTLVSMTTKSLQVQGYCTQCTQYACSGCSYMNGGQSCYKCQDGYVLNDPDGDGYGDCQTAPPPPPPHGCSDSTSLQCSAVANPHTCRSSDLRAACPNSCGCCEVSDQCVCDNDEAVQLEAMCLGYPWIHTCDMALQYASCDYMIKPDLLLRDLCPCRCLQVPISTK